MMKKKILSAFTALCCAVGCMGTTTFAQALTLNTGSTVMVIASGEDGYLMSNGSVIANTYMTTYLSTNSDLPVCGDVLSLTGCSIEPMEVGQYTFDEDGSITNLGDAEDCWAGREVLTVTEKKDGEALVSYTFCDAAGTEYAVTRFVWNEVYHESMGYTFTDSVGFESLAVGETYEFVMDDEGCPVLPVALNAEETQPSFEFIVIAVDNEETPENYIICDADDNATYYLTDEMLTQYLSDGESTPVFGDILTLEGELFSTVLDATNEIGFLDEQGTISITDSIFNYDETAEFSVTSINDRKIMLLKDDIEYSRYIDFINSYIQPGCIDLATVSTGDSVTCITYNGLPVLPVAVNAETTSPITDDTYVVSDIIQYSDGDAVYLLKGFSNRYHGLEPGYDIVFSASFISTLADIPQIGDLIQLEGEYVRLENPIPRLQRMSEDFTVSVVGDAAEYLESETFTVINDVDEINIEYADYYTLYNAEGAQISYTYMTYESFIPENTEVKFLMYDGKPVLPLSVTRLGDFNTDGDINAMDATRILMAAAAAGAGTEALSTASETAASPVGDVNADGEVNAMDATIVLVYAARNGAGAQVSVSEVATELME